MNHGLMHGMFWGGVLLSSIPVLLGIGIAIYVWREWRLQRNRRHSAAGAAEEVLS